MLISTKLKRFSYRFLGILAVIIGALQFSQAQIRHSCGAHATPQQIEYMAKNIRPIAQNYARFRTTATTYVPIKAHIIRTGSGAGGLGVAELVKAIDDMNVLYQNANISFYIYDEINFVDDDKFYDYDSSEESDLGSKHNVSNVINVYFANTVTSGTSNLCGYAYFPGGQDMVLMANSCTTNGSTLPHELGHYFALYHTHGKTNTGTTDELVDGSNCTTAGDDVCDTAADPNLSGNVDSDCSYTGNTTDANNATFTPDPRNIMSYSLQSCRTRFTQGQYDRISATLTNSRNYLLNSTTAPPSITSFTPDEGASGIQITITGTGFSATAADNIVKINGIQATVISSTTTQIVLNVPSTATTGLISVTVNKQTTYSSDSFLVPVNIFPYTESFESGLGAWTQASSDDFNWSIGSNTTPSDNTGPNSATNGTFYLFTEASSPNNPSKKAILQSSSFDFSNLPDPEFIFRYHMVGANMGTLQLEVTTNNGTTWTSLFSKTGDQGSNWLTETVDLSSYQVANVKFRFVGTTGSGFASDMAIDFIQVRSATAFYIGGFSPTTAREGDEVTITGGGFSATAADNVVKFNGQAATVISSTTTNIKVTVPDRATTGKITVEYNGGFATSSGTFTVVQPLALSSFSPTFGNVGTEVTITGTGFSLTANENIVKFNGTVAEVVSATETRIVTKAPQGFTTGKITIEFLGSTATSTDDFVLNSVTSLPQNLTKGKLELFPNPSSDIVNLKFSGNVAASEVSVQIYNLQGQLVTTFAGTVKNGALQIPVRQLAKGVYSAIISVGDNERVVRRIMRK
ncbi:hypothetical protein BKI52_12825 [marine bacterium AO1-C]|nr:hypothetical protein BKI52_12825 [marine bacterium AO1-C]